MFQGSLLKEVNLRVSRNPANLNCRSFVSPQPLYYLILNRDIILSFRLTAARYVIKCFLCFGWFEMLLTGKFRVSYSQGLVHWGKLIRDWNKFTVQWSMRSIKSKKSWSGVGFDGSRSEWFKWPKGINQMILLVFRSLRSHRYLVR